jgi:hypothetical protein
MCLILDILIPSVNIIVPFTFTFYYIFSVNFHIYSYIVKFKVLVAVKL